MEAEFPFCIATDTLWLIIINYSYYDKSKTKGKDRTIKTGQETPEERTRQKRQEKTLLVL